MEIEVTQISQVAWRVTVVNDSGTNGVWIPVDNSGIFPLPMGDPQSIADWSMVLSDTAGDMHPTIDQPIDDPRILEAQKEPLLQDFNLNFTYDTWYPQFNVAQNGKVIETPVEAINGQTPGEPAVHIIYKSPTTGQTIVVGDVEENQYVRLIDMSGEVINRYLPLFSARVSCAACCARLCSPTRRNNRHAVVT